MLHVGFTTSAQVGIWASLARGACRRPLRTDLHSKRACLKQQVSEVHARAIALMRAQAVEEEKQS